MYAKIPYRKAIDVDPLFGPDMTQAVSALPDSVAAEISRIAIRAGRKR
jgi:hypothetical protein